MPVGLHVSQLPAERWNMFRQPPGFHSVMLKIFRGLTKDRKVRNNPEAYRQILMCNQVPTFWRKNRIILPLIEWNIVTCQRVPSCWGNLKDRQCL